MNIKSVKDVFSEAIPVISAIAPTVARAIGGPFGMAVGYIIPILANAFDAKPSNLPGIVSNLLADPNASDKLQSIEEEHGDWLDELMSSVNNLLHAEINIKLDWAPKPL